MKRPTKVNDKQWVELDEVEEPPMTANEILMWLSGVGFIFNLVLFIILLASVLQEGACK